MKISAKKTKLDQIIWIIVGFYILVAHWIWYGRGIQESIIILLTSIAVIRRLRLNRIRDIWLYIIIACILGIVLLSGDILSPNTLSNLKAIYGGFISFIYVVQMKNTKPHVFLKYQKTMCRILNVYMAINSAIILGQTINHNFFLNRYAVDAVSNYNYLDHMTGLIGVNGSQRWNLIVCVTVLCNLDLLLRENGFKFSFKTKKEKKGIIRIVSMVLLNFLLCMINDTKSLLIVLPVLLLSYYIYKIRRDKKNRVRVIRYVAIVFFALILIYTFIPAINTSVNRLVQDKVRIYTSSSIVQMLNANDDRVVATYNSIMQSGLWGNGIGSVPMHLGHSGFIRYLGLNSASVYIYLFGIVGYLLFVALYSLEASVTKGKYNHRTSFIIEYIILLLISYLLPVFSYISLMFCYGVIVCISSNYEVVSLPK